METKLIEQKIKVSGWNEMYETTIKYPEDLEFYYTPGEIGKCKHIECEHYYAIFEKSRYSEEIIKEKKTQKNFFRNRDFYSADSDCRCFYICKTWQDEFYES